MEVAGADAVLIQHGINDIIHPVGIEVNPFRPWSDLPTAQGLIAVAALAVNVFAFAYILKRAKEQNKNPWKQEIFVGTKDYEEAIARAE